METVRGTWDTAVNRYGVATADMKKHEAAQVFVNSEHATARDLCDAFSQIQACVGNHSELKKVLMMFTKAYHQRMRNLNIGDLNLKYERSKLLFAAFQGADDVTAIVEAFDSGKKRTTTNGRDPEEEHLMMVRRHIMMAESGRRKGDDSEKKTRLDEDSAECALEVNKVRQHFEAIVEKEFALLNAAIQASQKDISALSNEIKFNRNLNLIRAATEGLIYLSGSQIVGSVISVVNAVSRPSAPTRENLLRFVEEEPDEEPVSIVGSLNQVQAQEL